MYCRPKYKELNKYLSRQERLEQMIVTGFRDRDVHDSIVWNVSQNQHFAEVGHKVAQRIFAKNLISA